jgi:hypothetical protein
MSDDADVIDDVTDDDPLIPDPKVFRDIGISAMTAWRWDRDKKMIEAGWPPQLKRGGRNFRSGRALRKFKNRLMREAIKVRRSILSRQQPAKKAASATAE